MLGMKDSRGAESKTLTFIWVAFAVSTVKWLLAGVQITELIGVPPMSAGEYSTLVIAILGIWLGREWQARA